MVRVSFQSVDRLTGQQVPDFHGPVHTGRSEVAAVGAKGHAEYLVGMETSSMGPSRSGEAGLGRTGADRDFTYLITAASGLGEDDVIGPSVLALVRSCSPPSVSNRPPHES